MSVPSPLVPTFDAHLSRRLRRLDLHGDRVVVRVRDGAIELRGDAGGVVRVPWADLSRLRVGYADGKGGPFYESVVRLADGRELSLVPLRESRHAYRDTVRALVAELQAAGRIDRVQSGLSKGNALTLPIAMGVLASAAVAISLFVLGGGPWWGRLLVPVIPLALTGLTLWVGLTRLWPRPIAGVADLDAQLPR